MKNPSNSAIWDLGKGITYAEFKKNVGQLSYLHAAELGYGQRIAFFANNHPAVAKNFLALSNIGSLMMFLDPARNPEENAKILKTHEFTHLAVTEDVKSKANEMIRAFNLSLNIVEIEKKKGGEYDPTYSPPPDKPLKETDQVLLVPSQGTTRDAHFMVFTHKQIWQAASLPRKWYHLGPNDRIMSTMNWAHPFSLVHGMLLPLFNGATCAVDPQHRNQEFIDYIAQQRINRLVGTPQFFFQLLVLCQSAKYLLPGMKSITVGLGMLSPTLRKTYSRIKVPQMHCYGMAENLWTIGIEDSEQPELTPEIEMRPLPGVKYKVLDDRGDEITGEGVKEGPLAVMAESVFEKYVGPEKDKKELEKDTKHMKRGTWLYTGDVVRLSGEDEELKIKFLGRQTDVIRNGKMFLAADPIDNAVKAIPGVEDAAGFFKQNMAGEEQVAVAVVKTGKGLGEKEVLDACAATLKSELQPRYVYFVESIPKDAGGNVNRFSLRRQFTGMD